MDYAEFSELSQIVHENMKGYFKTTPLIRYYSDSRPGFFATKRYESELLRAGDSQNRRNEYFEVDLKDFALIVSVAGENALLISETGNGKTSFVKGFLGSLFGNDYASIQVDYTFSPDSFRDINFGKMKSGSTLADAVEPGRALTAPGLLVDEFNRAPPQLLNLMQNFFENNTVMFEGAREITPGVAIADGNEVGPSDKNARRYQIKFATANVGSEYSGTFKFDKAALDRFPVVIDLDLFGNTRADRNMMNLNGGFVPKPVDDATAKRARALLFKLNEKVRSIEFETDLSEFLNFLGEMNNCYKAPEGTKAKIEGFSPETTCTGCVADAINNKICGNVYAPSERTLLNLKTMIKAFAAFRLSKVPGGPVRATIKDLMYVAPFVLNGKLNINPHWIGKYGHSSTAYATEQALNTIYDKWSNGIREIGSIQQKIIDGKELTADDRSDLFNFYLKNPWFGDKEIMQRIFFETGMDAAKKKTTGASKATN